MLQNRVDPFGNIILTSARGSWMGNRGVIHNRNKEIVSRFRHKSWITCQLQFKGRHRSVMSPGRWTELFFLDEATAFAAGHRPCFECRREDAKRFKECWIKGNPQYGFTASTSITDFDEVIHGERTDPKKQMLTQRDSLSLLANGSFVSVGDEPYLLSGDRLHLWTPFGYTESITVTSVESTVTLLTPHSIVNAFLAGYVPHVAI